jgi:hypothetical protein
MGLLLELVIAANQAHEGGKKHVIADVRRGRQVAIVTHEEVSPAVIFDLRPTLL